ncbi:MAG: GTP cyclohydrolase I FolE2 [Betaproteobacteria bacterium]|nr:GTP cyclohydrolase I FolE2 [Betaproteobacteria bacterium]
MNQRDPHMPIADVQSSADTRELSIDRVGIRSLRHPIRIQSETGAISHSVATFNMNVRLDHSVKGTHMSRFVEILETNPEPFSANSLAGLLERMVARLEVSEGRIEMEFPFFIEKTAPISGVKSLLDYEVTLAGEIKDGVTRSTTKVVVPVTSLCPCSKEISAYGAHNQRSHITISVCGTVPIAIEDVVRLAEEQASCELYGILKRPDEKYVTERAYDNPKFVEDLVRDVAAVLNADSRVETYFVESENFESIHNHSAYAMIECDKTKQ